MSKKFNINGDCKPEIHYMVDITRRLNEIKKMVDDGQYFIINRARQYGKTTTLKALKGFLENDYMVISLDFQLLGNADFETEQTFVEAFSSELLENTVNISKEVKTKLETYANDTANKWKLRHLFGTLNMWCCFSEKKIVLIIDEIDSAANNQVFLDFLSQIRGYYLNRDVKPFFQSVILAGVYDVKNIRRKIRPEEEHKRNSPWNIAAPFRVDMSFSEQEIAGMLSDYEKDYHTGMDIETISSLLYDYTSGYPFLVSQLCKLMDEVIAGSETVTGKKAAWTEQGFLEAVRILLSEKNALFESLIGKLRDYPELYKIVYDILFGGKKIVYNPDSTAIDIAIMFGFAKNEEGSLVLANRIFEMRLYNYFLTTSEAQSSRIFTAASDNKSQYIRGKHLDMDMVMKKFVEHYDSIYGDQKEEFDEDEGRRRFLLYIRPIINGTGNYYIEAETRNARRMDVVIDYLGERFIVELKLWRGASYNKRGEKQLTDYLDYFKLKKGYMLSYNFNQKKEIGVKEICVDGRMLVEAVV